MMFRNRIISLIFILVLVSCGFRPLYSNQRESATLGAIKLGEVSTGKLPSKIDYCFRSELKTLLDALDRHQQKLYVLDVVLEKTLTSYGTQQNTTNTRTLLILTAKYTLRNIGTGKVTITDSHKTMDSFEVSVSPYASVVSEDETANKLAKYLAHEILLKLEDVILKEDANNNGKID